MCSIAHWCPTLCYPMDCRNHQASLSMGFSRQEYWSRLPFPTSGDLLDPGIEPVSPAMTDSLQDQDCLLEPLVSFLQDVICLDSFRTIALSIPALD